VWLATVALAAPLVAGDDHTCVLRGGVPWCWGDGQLAPAPVLGIGDAVDLVGGDDHVCARRADGTAACFRVGGPGPIAVEPLGPADAVAAGSELSCTATGGGVGCVGRLRLAAPPPEPRGGGVGTLGRGGLGAPPGPPPRPPPPGGTRLPVEVPATGLVAGQGWVCGVAAGAARCAGWDDAARTWRAYAPDVRDARAVVAAGVTPWVVDRAGTVWVGAGSGPRAPLAAATGPLTGIEEVAAHDVAWCARRGTEVWCGGLLGDPLGRPVDFGPVVALAVGRGHACGLRADGEVACLGRGASGALGTGVEARSDAAVPVAGLEDAVSIAAGNGFTCAARRAGPPVCWGSGAAAAGGRPGLPGSVDGVAGAVQVVAGTEHACARADGGVWCWGEDGWGQLGDGEGRPPRPIALPGPASAVAVGAYGPACALVDGSPWCWGRDHGPARVALDRVTSLATDHERACAARADGTVWCWSGVEPPVAVPGVRDAVEVAGSFLGWCARIRAGGVTCWNPDSPPAAVPGVSGATSLDVSSHACALDRGGVARCWGTNEGGALGTSPDALAETTEARAVDVLGSGLTAVAVGAETTCGRGRDGAVRCVGLGRYGAFGDGTWRTIEDDWAGEEGDRPARTGTVDGPPLASIDLGDGADPGGCGVDADGAVWCWGASGGPLAERGRDGDPARPAKVLGLPPVAEVTVADGLACARTAAGAVWCWGDAEDARLPGEGRPEAAAVVGLPGSATLLAAGGSATCAVVGREVWCWGWNVVYDGDDEEAPLHSAIPGRIGAAGGPAVLAVGHFQGCASAGGTTRCFGEDTLGALGAAPVPLPREDRWAWPAPPPPPPAPAAEELPPAATGLFGESGFADLLGGPSLADELPQGLFGGGLGGDGPAQREGGPKVAEQQLAARSLAIGGLGTCAVSTTGEVTCWGRPGAEAPVTVASGAVQVAVGEELACLVRREGVVACWTRDRGPTEVEGTRGAVEVAVGRDHACARLADGGVRCWGEDRSGQLGRGVSVVSPAPVRVPFPEVAR
jgi:alpha-tubulin suppressor-like RCC1 family protein